MREAPSLERLRLQPFLGLQGDSCGSLPTKRFDVEDSVRKA